MPQQLADISYFRAIGRSAKDWPLKFICLVAVMALAHASIIASVVLSVTHAIEVSTALITQRYAAALAILTTLILTYCPGIIACPDRRSTRDDASAEADVPALQDPSLRRFDRSAQLVAMKRAPTLRLVHSRQAVDSVPVVVARRGEYECL